MLGDGEEDGRSPNDSDSMEGSDISWRGCSMDEIYRQLDPFKLDHVAVVKPSETHTVLHHFPIREDDSQPPRPLRAHHKWDAFHVRLPCSNKSQYPVMGEDGTSTIENRWEMIEKALLRPIKDSHDLQNAILSYNTKYQGQWNFRALHKLFEHELDEDEAKVFFEDLLPRIIRLALRLPELVQAPIPLLKQWKCHALTLTQEQISCLLANAFLCTYPRRNTLKSKSEYSAFPDINFNRLFQSSGAAVLEKIKCICHYFRRVCPTDNNRSNVPTGCVTFERRNIAPNDMPNWGQCNKPLGVTPLHITSEGTIEDQGVGLLQVDFANKFLGGGVLGGGCVQEEIRFVICPELIVSKLFTECLRPSEALIMVGCERFSEYSGYANTFQWDGNHVDNTPRDSSRRRLCHIVAIDALNFHESSHQYREELMLRELNKAYVGFFHPLTTLAPGVASGNWGCGAFGGEATLKALLQLMVCTVTGRPLVYYTFGNDALRDEVHKMHTYFIENNILVKDLWCALKKFQSSKLGSNELYRFLYVELEKIKRRPEEDVEEVEPNIKKKWTNDDDDNEDNGTIKKAEKSEKPKTTIISPSDSLSPEPCTSSSSSMKIKRSLEESLDVFASTSSEAENSKILPSVASIIDLSISDDGELEFDDNDCKPDAVTKMMAKSPNACENIKNTTRTKQGNNKTPATTPRKEARTTAGASSPAATKPRQRTLLEMLDQTYNQLTGPATKRYCVSKPSQQQKALKPEEDPKE